MDSLWLSRRDFQPNVSTAHHRELYSFVLSHTHTHTPEKTYKMRLLKAGLALNRLNLLNPVNVKVKQVCVDLHGFKAQGLKHRIYGSVNGYLTNIILNQSTFVFSIYSSSCKISWFSVVALKAHELLLCDSHSRYIGSYRNIIARNQHSYNIPPTPCVPPCALSQLWHVWCPKFCTFCNDVLELLYTRLLWIRSDGSLSQNLSFPLIDICFKPRPGLQWCYTDVSCRCD